MRRGEGERNRHDASAALAFSSGRGGRTTIAATVLFSADCRRIANQISTCINWGVRTPKWGTQPPSHTHTHPALPLSLTLSSPGGTPLNLQLVGLGKSCEIPSGHQTHFVAFRVHQIPPLSTRFCPVPPSPLYAVMRHLVCLWMPVFHNQVKISGLYIPENVCSRRQCGSTIQLPRPDDSLCLLCLL